MSNQSLIGEDEEVKQSYEEFSIRDTYGRGTKRERETQRPLKTPAEPAPKKYVNIHIILKNG